MYSIKTCTHRLYLSLILTLLYEVVLCMSVSSWYKLPNSTSGNLISKRSLQITPVYSKKLANNVPTSGPLEVSHYYYPKVPSDSSSHTATSANQNYQTDNDWTINNNNNPIPFEVNQFMPQYRSEHSRASASVQERADTSLKPPSVDAGSITFSHGSAGAEQGYYSNYGYGVNDYKHHNHHDHHHHHNHKEEDEESFEIEDKVFSKAIAGTKTLTVGKFVFTFFMVLVVIALGIIAKTGVSLSPVILPLALLPIGIIALALFVPLFFIFVPIVATGLGGGKRRKRRKRRSSSQSNEMESHIVDVLSSALEYNIHELYEKVR